MSFTRPPQRPVIQKTETYKPPPPPKRGMSAPEIGQSNDGAGDDALTAKASGLDKLFIAKKKVHGAGVQTGG